MINNVDRSAEVGWWEEPELNAYSCHFRLQTVANDQNQEVRSKK